MTYPQTLDYLFEKLPMYQRVGAAAYKADLNNTIAICKALGNPEKKIKCVHVAGTNGKGSSSHMLAAILQQAGYKTGLYTSPHFIFFSGLPKALQIAIVLLRSALYAAAPTRWYIGSFVNK